MTTSCRATASSMSRAIPAWSKSASTAATRRRWRKCAGTARSLPSARTSAPISFPIPSHGFRWLPTRQPVVTDLWKTERRRRRAGALFTSVANWNTSGLKDIEWRGEKYLWSKSLEFLKFIEAPRRAGETV